MTKRKRTYEQVEAMQEKAVRFQESLFHIDAAYKLEMLSPEQYADLRNIEIVDEPVQKRKRRKKKDVGVPPGYKRHTEVTESQEKIPGGTRRVRIVKGWLVKKTPKGKK
jgi:hypothetical protein